MTFNTIQSKPLSQATFMSSVWSFFGMAIFIAALGAWSGEFLVRSLGFWIPYFLFMGVMLTSGIWIQSKTFKLPMFVLFTFLSGTVMFPTLAFAGATGQIDAVIKAFISGGLTFFIAAVWGFTTKKDLSTWGNFLYMGIFGLFGIGIIGLIGQVFDISFLKFTSGFSVFLSIVSVILFTAFTSYDIQNIKKGMYSSPLVAAFHMYFNLWAIIQDMMNIFLSREN